jgi:hypothetical protein
MSMAQRGLWDTLRKECWVNGSVPSEKSLLAKFLGIGYAELESLLTQDVLGWFVINGTEMRCKELDLYRELLQERKQGQIDGGKKGGLKTQEKNRASVGLKYDEKNVANLEGDLKVLIGDERRRDEMRGGESSVKTTLSKEQQEWVNDYDTAVSPWDSDYRRASKGY